MFVTKKKIFVIFPSKPQDETGEERKTVNFFVKLATKFSFRLGARVRVDWRTESFPFT